MRYIYIFITLLILAGCSTPQATKRTEPVVKEAVVGSDADFEDVLQFPFDDKGLDLTIKMSFDEELSELKMTLTGTRQLLVFRNDVVYNRAFKKAFFGKRYLNPDKLPYPVLVQQNTKYCLSKDLWKSFPKLRSAHLFNKWLGKVSNDFKVITPTTTTEETPEATLVVDSIVQRFKVNPNATGGTIQLRNVLAMDQLGDPVANVKQKRDPKKKVTYSIVADNDLNLTYKVKLKRNPCFGKDAEIDSLLTILFKIRKDYRQFEASCPNGKAESREQVGVFNQHRQYLLAKYAAIADSSDCSDIQSTYNYYNKYRDSIKTAKCVYIPPKVVKPAAEAVAATPLSADMLLDAARRLDNTVSRYLVTRDAMEVYDLTKLGREIVRTTDAIIKERTATTPEQQRALAIYKRAREYFNTVVLKM